MKSNVIFVKFQTRLQRTNIVVVLVLRPLYNSELEDEDEHEYEKKALNTPHLNPGVSCD